MFKVECPGCKAPYQVDERRVPAAGLKMRCPKCGTTFNVDAPGGDSEADSVLGASLGLGPESSVPKKKKPPLPRRAIKKTQLGVAPMGAVPKAPPPPAPGQSMPESEGFGEIDLPVLRDTGSSPKTSEPALPAPRDPAASLIDIDLPDVPVVPTSVPADLPASVQPASGGDLPAVPRPNDGADLPAVGGGGGGFGDIDLPAPAAQLSPSGLDVDLPSLSDDGVSLPSPRADLPAVGGAELPSLGGAELPSLGGAALPSPGGAELPALGGAQLPAVNPDLPAAGGAGLPEMSGSLPAASAGLPQAAAALPGTAAGLPGSAAGLPGNAAGLPDGAAGAPAPSGGFGELDLPLVGGEPPAPAAEPPSVAAAPPAGGGLEFELGGGAAPSAPPGGQQAGDEFDFGAPPPSQDFDAPPSDGFGTGFAPPSATVGDPMAEGPTSGVVREAGGGVAYGEVNLGGGDAPPLMPSSGPPSGGGEDDMEFGAIPQEDEQREPGAVPTQPGPAHVEFGDVAALQPEPSKKRGVRVGLAVVALAVVGGGALTLVPGVGPFGAHWITDQVRAGEYRELVTAQVKSAQKDLASDTFTGANSAMGAVAKARKKNKRIKPLAAYAAYLAYATDLRFGVSSAVTAKAKVILDELQEAGDVRYLELARAAQAGAQGQIARARKSVVGLAKAEPNDIDVATLRGEVELKAKDAKAAVAAWEAAVKLAKSPRTLFGLARAQLLAGNSARAAELAQQVLATGKTHSGARILLAKVAWTSRRDEETAVKLLTAVIDSKDQASIRERVSAYTMLGTIHLERSRITHAEKAFTAALKSNPKAARALTGLGDALFLAGRFSEALARFEASIQADPDDIAAKVGVARTKLALERLDDAKALLAKLRAAHPKSVAVLYWSGRVEDALGNRDIAEKAYRTAIKLGTEKPKPSDPAVVDAYVAMAMILNQRGKPDEAAALLDEAQKKLPDSPEIFKALAEVALGQGRYEESILRLNKALKIDGDDIGARFKLGVAYRRDRQFDKAADAFKVVEKVDRDYPGLALERGLLYQASGRSDEALKEYEAALAKAPNDPDLMLRVGCAKVAAGRGGDAEKLLRKVLQTRVSSAETHHCLGRALLAKGTNLAEALKTLQRAVDLDPHRAEYHMYVGWAANEAGQSAKADKALAKALELDQSLADAYWQRGVLRHRQGAVKKAIADLEKALELRPTRFEAYAALADSYVDLRREADAMAAWDKAIAAHPDNATWRFRYGKLLVANNRNGDARTHLEKALEYGDKISPKPRWLWEAHRLLARAMGRRREAIKHWQAFLKTGPRDSPYRGEAIEALAALGSPWTDD